MMDQNGTLWAGTNFGLNEFIANDRQFNRYGFNSVNSDFPKLLNNPLVNTIFQDRSGSIWIGTSGGGINRFDYSTDFFTHNYHDPGIEKTVNGNMIWAFEEDSDLGYWIGTEVGVDRYNILSGEFEHYPIINEPSAETFPVQVYRIYKSYDARVWAGTSNGLFLLDQENKQFIKYQLPTDSESSIESTLSESIILDMVEAGPGHIWAGTYGSGLISLDIERGLEREFTFDQNDPSSISSDIVSSVFIDSKGIAYIGTRGGGLNLLYPDSTNFLRFTSTPGATNSISDNNINQIIQSHDGNIWIATMGGLTSLIQIPVHS